jgi:hypothetical protein
MGRVITLPGPGDPATNDLYGVALNAAINQVNDDLLAVRKTADQALNTTTLTNDTHLLLPVAINATYLLEWWLRMDGPAANDFKCSWTGPAGSAMVWSSLGLDVAAVANVAPISQDAPTLATVIQHGTIAAGTFSHVRGRGYFTTAGTAGTLQLQWAQVAAAASTTLKLGSHLYGQRVA